jgi:DNA replication protein DnaC
VEEKVQELMTRLLSEIKELEPERYDELKARVDDWKQSLGCNAHIVVIPYLKKFLQACKDPDFAIDFFAKERQEEIESSLPREKKRGIPGLPDEFVEMTLEDVEDRDNIDGFYDCLNGVNEYIENITSHIKYGEGISIHGEAGTGKTMFACIVAQEVAEKGYSVMIATAREIADKARNMTKVKYGSSLFGKTLVEIDLLVIDDLGAEYRTTFSDAEVDRVISERYNKRKPTIVTSNLFPDELVKKLVMRVTDRIGDRNNVFAMTGLSYRKLRRYRETGEKPVLKKEDDIKELMEEIKKDIYTKSEKPVVKVFNEKSPAYKLSLLLRNRILENKAGAKVPSDNPKSMAKWSHEMDLMIRRDKKDPEEIRRIINWCQDDDSWMGNILSVGKLRKQYDRLVSRMEQEEN